MEYIGFTIAGLIGLVAVAVLALERRGTQPRSNPKPLSRKRGL